MKKGRSRKRTKRRRWGWISARGLRNWKEEESAIAYEIYASKHPRQPRQRRDYSISNNEPSCMGISRSLAFKASSWFAQGALRLSSASPLLLSRFLFFIGRITSASGRGKNPRGNNLDNEISLFSDRQFRMAADWVEGLNANLWVTNHFAYIVGWECLKMSMLCLMGVYKEGKKPVKFTESIRRKIVRESSLNFWQSSDAHSEKIFDWIKENNLFERLSLI